LEQAQVLNQYNIWGNIMMNAEVYEYETELLKNPEMDATYIEFPWNVRKEFGKGRVKVHAEFDGEPYDGSVVNMGVKYDDGSICYIIVVCKDIRRKINKQAGDKIKVKITERK
jgi:hypothetical protein